MITDRISGRQVNEFGIRRYDKYIWKDTGYQAVYRMYCEHSTMLSKTSKAIYRVASYTSPICNHSKERQLADCSANMKSFVMSVHYIRVPTKEKLNTREGQSESTPLDKCNFTWTTKGVRCYFEFQLWRIFLEGLYI